jgi:putative copper resistance protein D
MGRLKKLVALRGALFAGCIFVFAIFLISLNSLVFAQDHSTHDTHQGMDMDHSMNMPMDESPASTPEKLLADKLESEFNHHLAGFFVVLAGVFILAEPRLSARWPKIRYAWPMCFLLAGIFVFIYSDTELWPFGPQSWLYGLREHAEVRQHKSFAVILLALGVIEFLRARGTLKAAWSAWVFPVLAVTGSIILLFHEHQGGMHGAGHMERMARIQTEHHTYTLTGLSLGLTKGLSEIKTHWQSVFAKLWPSIMIFLGVLLMFYVE